MFGRIPEVEVSQDFFNDARFIDEAEYSQTAAALGTSQRVCKIHFANEARPGASAETAEVVVLSDIGT